MFGKKKQTPPPTPFLLQVLTADYLIEGMAEGNEQLYLPNSQENWSPIELASVQIKVTGQPDAPVRTAAHFTLHGDGIVAIIPRRDVSEMAQYAIWEDYDYRREGLFYVGPYLILGAMMFNGEDLFDDTSPMVDVTIRHRLPNAAMSQLSAPFILVNTKWLSGYEPA